MIAKQTVFLTAAHVAVAEGAPGARFKLVHIGQEISEAQALKYDGALDLINSEGKPATVNQPPPVRTKGRIELEEDERDDEQEEDHKQGKAHKRKK